MIFLDTNYFLRYLVQPETPESEEMARMARSVFEAVAQGLEQITTTEVVLHEVAYILASKAHYNQTVEDITRGLRLLLGMPGFRLPPGAKRRYLRALDVWDSHPRLGLADAIIAASVEEPDIPLATFDSHFTSIPSIRLWPPSSENGSTP